MLKPKPFKNAEVNPEPPKRDLRDFVELFFSFLWFHHKKIAGLILLAGLGYWIYYVKSNPNLNDDNSTVQRSSQSDQPDDVPKSNLDFVDSDGKTSTDIESGNRVESNAVLAVDSIAQNDSSSQNDVRSKNGMPQPIESGKKSASGNLERLLENGSVDDLIEKSLKLSEQWGAASPGLGIVMCAERAKISRRLLERDSAGPKLSDSQRKYALISYIESVSLVDSLNVAGQMKLTGTRNALAEIESKYCEHADSDVQAKANLSMIVAPIYDFLETGQLEHLHAIEMELGKRFDRLSGERSSLIRLAELTVAVLSKSTDETNTVPISNQVLKRIELVATPEAKRIAAALKERIVFAEFDPPSLPLRVENRDAEARAQVQGFFKTLAEHPNSSQGIYESAVRTILAYHLLQQEKDVAALTDWLETIVRSIEKEPNRDAALEALVKLREKVGMVK